MAAARLKTGSAQSFRLANLTRIFINATILEYMRADIVTILPYYVKVKMISIKSEVARYC